MIERPSDEEYEAAEKVLRRLRGADHMALFAGGCVRDLLLGRTPVDYDIATEARPEEVAEMFEDTRMVGRQFGVCQVMLNGRCFEVARFRRESGYADGRHPSSVEFCGPEEDAKRRDFTINAIFWDPVGERLLDFVNGRQDLEAELIRAVGDPEKRLREDHLRFIRAVRFAARLDFEIESRTRGALKALRWLTTEVAPERLQQELRVILTDRNPARALRLMDELGMLSVIFPELEDAKGCEQPENYHPEGDVFVHTMLSVEKLGAHPDFELALATVLHDVGKPPASRRGDDDPMNFYEHERIGARMAERVCGRLRLPNRDTERVRWLVKRHLYFRNAQEMRESTLKKLFAEPGFHQLGELHRVDSLASWGRLEDYEYVMARRATVMPEPKLPPRLVTGDDLIDMGYEPGPVFGEVLRRVRDAQLDGQLETREEALRLAGRLADELKRNRGD